MGKKKQRSSSSGLKPPPSTTSSSSLMPPPSTTTTSTSKPPQHPPPESLDPVIFAEGSKVQDEIKAGNYPKASLTLRNLISLHKNSPHLLYLKAVVLQFLAKTTANASKQMIAYLKEANELVELALKLLPNSIHFASCKIAILYLKTLIDDGDWGKMIEECKSALSLKIENLTDPGVDMFLQVNEMANSTKESRIEFERKMIEQYLKLCEEEHKQAENANKENADKAGDTLHEIKEEFETEIKSYHVFKKIKSHYGMEKYYEVNAVKKEEYKSLWDEFRSEGKRDFCEVSIKELERHWKSINFHLAGREAIDFAKKHKTWKGWECCGCNEKFGDLELYRKHSRESHWKNLDAMELQFQIPGKVIEFIENGEWKPLNAEYWVKKIVSKMNSESCDGNLFDEESLKESLCESIGRKNNERELSERVKILKSIRGMFRLLHRYNCLAPSYLNCAVQFTVEQLTINFEDQRYFLQRLDLEAIQIICLLRAADLKKVREFLQEFTDAFGKFIKPKFVSPLDDNLSFVQVFNVNEKPGISEVLKSRLLDERFLEGADNLTLPDSQDLVTWLYEGTSIQVVLMAWSGLQDYQKQKSKEIFQILLKEYSLVEKLCDDPTYKRENTNLLKAIEAVESIKLEDIEGNESTTMSYFRLLKKRQKELVQYDDIASKKENNVIFEVITDMLDLAQSEGSSLTDNPNAFETFTDEAEMKMLESIEAGESAARFDLQSMRIESLKKLALMEAKILWGICAIKQHELKLEKMALHDYSTVIVPLLKSYLQANLQVPFDKDLRLKFNSKAEDMLKDFGDDSSSSVKEKEKQNKKKNKKKKSRQNEKSEGAKCDVPDQHHPENTEKIDNPDSETGVSASDEDLMESVLNDSKLLEEQLEKQRKIEEEFAERKSFQADAEKVEGLNLDSASAEDLGELTVFKNEYEEKEKLKADIGEAVCLSLDSFEHKYGLLPAEVTDGSLREPAIHHFLIVQSFWRLRKLHDDCMSKSRLPHKHEGNPCFYCASDDSVAVTGIIRRIMPQLASQVTLASEKCPIQTIFHESINAISVPARVHECELKDEIVEDVLEIYEELEADRKIENEAKQEDL